MNESQKYIMQSLPILLSLRLFYKLIHGSNGRKIIKMNSQNNGINFNAFFTWFIHFNGYFGVFIEIELVFLFVEIEIFIQFTICGVVLGEAIC